MPQRKAWTPQQDRTLKYLRQQLQINKWSIIAKKMTQQFQMPGRTGKQCRQRRSQWTKQQQQNLYSLHDQIGNKWAIIAQKLPGRMRKAIRKLNKAIHQHFKKQYKQIKMPVLYKIVQATDQKFKSNPGVEQQVSQRCCKIKNLLLQYSNDDNNPLDSDLMKLKQLSNQIHDFSNKYKHKHKKSRRSSVHQQDLLRIPNSNLKGKNKSNSDKQSQSQQQYSMVYQKSYGQDDSSFSIKQQIPPPGQKSKTQNTKAYADMSQISQKQNQGVQKMTLKIPAILPRNSLTIQDQNIQQQLKIRGLLQRSLQRSGDLTNSRTIGKRGSGMSSISILRRQDSLGYDDGTNMLAQSIQGLKIGNDDFAYQVQIDEQNNLFMSR